jgi:Leucine-rich repeat (LRR) protein
MIRGQVGRILFGLFASVLLFTQTLPYDIQPVQALGPYPVATGTDKFSTAQNNQRKLAITSDSTIHAVYSRADGSGIWQIYNAYSSDNGTTWTEEQVTSASRDQVHAALAVDSQDNLHFVWQDGDEGKMSAGDNPVTYYRGKNKLDGWQVAESVSSYATYPAVAVDSNDNVHVVYGNFIYPPGGWGGGNGIRWKEKTASGWQPEESLSSNKTWTTRPAIAIDSNDNIHVVWNNSPRLYFDTNYRERTASGWGTEVQVNTELDNATDSHQSIAVDGNNYVHIVWERTTSGNSSIRYREFTTSWQPPVDIEGPTPYNQSYPVISIDNLGHVYIVWTGQNSDSTTVDQIRYREYTDSWQPVQNLTSSISDNQTYPSLLWARYPIISGAHTNQPENGFSLIWNDSSVIRFYSNTDPVVTFPDANLEAAIREVLSKPVGNIYASELAGLTSLDAEDREIVDLSGIEYCTNLVRLHLSSNQISDLTPLSNLTNITELWLAKNQIADVTPLAVLNTLSWLHLSCNHIVDTTPLSSITSLSSLMLSENQIGDITPLANLTNLNLLWLSGNQISDITPLSNLTNLNYLLLGENQISDITPLAGLINLNELWINDNQISNLTPLSGLTNLTSLLLFNNQISDIAPLASLTNLIDLQLSGNQISDLSPVTGLTKLVTLILHSNQISNLSSLAGLTNLQTLMLDDNQISNLTPLIGLINLGWLSLDTNQISDIASLVSNIGLATGDTVTLKNNPLSPTSINVYIPALQARGVTVVWDAVPPATIILTANPKGITANGSSTSTITATVKDDQGNNVPDGTIVTFTTSAGSIGSTTTTKPTTNGIATATLTSSRTDGVATVTATSGDTTAATVVFFTRPGLTVTDYFEEETPPGQYTVDAKSIGDIEVIKSGDGTPTVTVATYSRNPAGPTPGGFSAAGDYVDVHLTSTDNVTQIEIRKYYTADEIRGMRETTLRIRWWSGSGWVECSNSGVNTDDVNSYSGYVWAIITDSTIPNLADLSGCAFVSMGPVTTTTTSPTSTASSVSPTVPRPLNPAQMSVQYLSINPQQINANQPIKITTNVVNIGDQAGNFNVILKIDGQTEQQKMVSVGPQSSQPVKFTVARSQPGVYNIDIGGQKGSFTVFGANGNTTHNAAVAMALATILTLGLLLILVVVLLRRRAYY